MDPILEEMKRAKSLTDVKESRFRDWVQYLCALVAAKDDEIARLKAEIDDDNSETAGRRGPGRPKNCRECGQPETRHAESCSIVMAVPRG